MTINSQTYTGIGYLGQVSVVPDGAKMVAEQKSFRLSGSDPSLVSEADIDACFGRSVTEYFGFLSNGALVATPEINWEGRMDSVNRVDSSEPYIEVLAKSRMALLDISNGWRYTHEHQQQFFAGDNGLNLIASVLTAQVTWGGQKVTAGILSGGVPNTKTAVLNARRG